MNETELKKLMPRASASFLKANADSPRQVAKLESNTFNAPLGALKVQKGTATRFLVRVISYRKRLLDEDNLCEKFHVDLCRYAGILPSDAPGKCKIEVRQIKSKVEQTVIEIESQ